MNDHMNSLNREWTSYAQEQLSLGGAKLFQFVAKQGKSISMRDGTPIVQQGALSNL